MLVEAVRAALATLPEGAGVAVAVSGGPDSAALADLACRARPDLALTLVHVRHGLRDDASDAVAARALAGVLDVPFREVRAGADAAGSPEEVARRRRYAALRTVVVELGAVGVLVGHTADDRAETVLLRIVRGTGTGGLRGMARDGVVHGVRVLRPLLALRRSAVRGHARARQLPVALDPTNADHEQPRARARALLPQLDRLAGGPRDAVTTILRLADLAAADAAALDALAGRSLGAVRRWGPAAALPEQALAGPQALATRVVRGVVSAAGGGAPSAAAVTSILDLAPGCAVTLPGDLRVARGSGWLVALPAGVLLDPVALRRDASAPVGALQLAVATGSALGSEAVVPPGARGPAQGALPGPGPWLVRGPERGDRLPDGRGLADALARSGVPRLLRGLVPVVCDAGERPLWAPGVGRRQDPADGTPVALLGGR